MKVLGLFSGMGGMELGFQRAGYEIIGMCENEPWCQALLSHQWPSVPIFPDIRGVRASLLHDLPDVICGGFPCQDISNAGLRRGLGGPKSSLWWEFRRVLEEVLPSWALIENVSALLTRGLGEVLQSLAAIGYDAEWHCLPAHAVGAPHKQRDRVWIIAHHHQQQVWIEQGRSGRQGGAGETLSGVDGGERPLSNNNKDVEGGRVYRAVRKSDWWETKPSVGPVVYGIPRGLDRHRWMHRLHAIGNSVIVQQVEDIARAMLVRHLES